MNEPDYTDKPTIFRSKIARDHLPEARQRNNPRSEPVGHYTGRCNRCGSSNLWDDNLHYGCNSCGALLA